MESQVNLRSDRRAKLPRLRVGARRGARIGLFIGLIAALAAVVPSPRRGPPLPPLPIFIAVWIGCVTGAMLVALGRPAVRDKYGAALLGAAATVPVLIALAVAEVGMTVMSPRGILGTGAVSLLLGGWFGVAQWSPRRANRS